MKRFTKAACIAFFWGYLLCMASGRALAVPQDEPEPARPIIPMVHTKWLVKDGVPPNVRALAQTPDGWLWLASSVGLFRFDGVSFSQYEPPRGITLPAHIQRIGVLRDGTLWASGAFGDGLYFIRGEKLHVFDSNKNEAPRQLVENIAEDLDGNTWMVGMFGLYRLNKDGQTWTSACNDPDAPKECVSFTDIFIDSRGTIWLKAGTGILARPRGAKTFERIADSTMAIGRFSEAPDGSVWVSDTERQLRRVYVERIDPRHDILLDTRDGLFGHGNLIDRQGNFWMPTSSGGVLRVDVNRKTPEKQAYTRQQGLSGLSAVTMLEDREGNIWVATESGLDQFRPSRVTEMHLPPTAMEGRALAPGPNGELWVDRFHLRSMDAKPLRFSRSRRAGSIVLTLHRDPKGTIWEARSDGISRFDGGVETPIPRPVELRDKPLLYAFSMATDSDGVLWVAFGRSGCWQYKDGKWSVAPGLEGYTTATISIGSDGAMWFGSFGSFAILRNGQVQKFGLKDGLDLGTVMQIVPKGTGAYLGGENGLAYFDGRRVTRIKGNDNQAFPGASGLVLASDGKLWSNTGHGLVGIPASELQRVIHEPAYRVRYQRFDENDGLTGGAPPIAPLPSMIWNSKGELVIATTTSVFRFDPERHLTNTVVPPVHITSISDGRTVQHPVPNLKLASAPDTIRIDYTALSLSLPHRVNFRYQLEGVDHGWQDAGARRSVFYTQLAPGHYSFRVIAANNDGVWNNEGARFDFVIPPTWTQTLWFKLLCATAVAIVVWLLHRLRLQITLKRHSLAHEARAAERERIARDLHDTLLQSVQGLILSFKRVANRISNDPSTKSLAEQALALATEVLIEGRNKVGGLREDGHTGDLAPALDAHGKQLAEQYGPRFTLTISGEAQLLQPAVFNEALAIGREAVQNAFVHAQASDVMVELDFGTEIFAVRIIDNGRGIEEQYRRGRSGHWGIPGMGERAATLGATLELLCDEGQGCTWVLQIAARAAYASPGPGTSPMTKKPPQVA